MGTINKIASVALLFLSGYMMVEGVWIFINTKGAVVGSEFGLLITLANLISLVVLWLALFTVCTCHLRLNIDPPTNNF